MEEMAVVSVKEYRHRLADRLEDWGKRHGIYAVPTISTNQIKREILRTPWFSNKEDHIRKIVRQFGVTQPVSIKLILIEIHDSHPIEYSIALNEFEGLNEH